MLMLLLGAVALAVAVAFAFAVAVEFHDISPRNEWIPPSQHWRYCRHAEQVARHCLERS